RQAAREIQFLFDHQSLFTQIAQCNLPRRVTHHDTKINNILFDQKTHKARAIIDLDTLMPGTVLSDFGDMVRTFANAAGEEGDPADVRLLRPVYEAIRAGFLSEMKDLTATESAHLSDGAKWITLMQAMRFLTDFLSGDVYYKTRFEGQNLRRAQNQIALFNQIKLLK
ncbi:MAG: aminoglycoside phosphotransferase family protein, partial [Bacteroidetes bacterium]